MRPGCCFCDIAINTINCLECGHHYCNNNLSNRDGTTHAMLHITKTLHQKIAINGIQFKCNSCTCDKIIFLYYNSMTMQIKCKDCIVIDDFSFTKILHIIPRKIASEFFEAVPDDLLDHYLATKRDQFEQYGGEEAFCIRKQRELIGQSVRGEPLKGDVKDAKTSYDSFEDYFLHWGFYLLLQMKYFQESFIAVQFKGVKSRFTRKNSIRYILAENGDQYLFKSRAHYLFVDPKFNVQLKCVLNEPENLFDQKLLFQIIRDESLKSNSLDNITTFMDVELTESIEFAIYREIEAIKSLKDNALLSKILGRVKVESAGNGEPSDDQDFILHDLEKLNEDQQKCVRASLQRDFLMIQGPPGTGKSLTAAFIALKLLDQNPEKRILVCTPSNVSADSIAKYLMDHARSDQLSKLCRFICKSRKNVQKQAKFAESNFLINHRIIISTCGNATPKNLKHLNFEIVILDEANRVHEIEGLIPLSMGCKKLILVGDHAQTPPIILNESVIKHGYHISLMERLIQNGGEYMVLQTQYRMHQKIYEFPNHLFYGGKVDTSPDIDVNMGSERVLFPNPDIPIIFVDSGMNNWEEISSNCNSIENRAEALIIVKLLRNFLQFPNINIGILSFYNGQCELIKAMIQPLKDQIETSQIDIDITTIDTFQGSEKDYVILSCVSNKEPTHYLLDPKRINVGMTRARKGFIMTGNSNCLKENLIYGKFIEFCQENSLLHSATDLFR